MKGKENNEYIIEKYRKKISRKTLKEPNQVVMNIKTLFKCIQMFNNSIILNRLLLLFSRQSFSDNYNILRELEVASSLYIKNKFLKKINVKR